MGLPRANPSRWGPEKWSPNPRTHALSPKRNNMTRPKISEPRCHQLNLSLTARELESIKKRAAALGMRPVHFGRAMLLDRNIQPAVKSEVNDHTQRMIHAQLVRLGNNLNQMVRNLHRTGDPLPPDLEPLLTDIRHVIERRVRQ